jgi:ribosomal protein S18 acetylase RimI-like enzyme
MRSLSGHREAGAGSLQPPANATMPHDERRSLTLPRRERAWYHVRMLSIRRASVADVDALSPLKASVHEQHVKERPDFFKPMALAEVAAWLRKRLGEEASQAWLAEDRGVPVGYLLAARRQREESSYSIARQWCEVDEIIVDETCRRQGVARALMDRAIAHARELGLDVVELTAWAFNEHAQAAFARLGFQPMLVRYEAKRAR